MIKALQKIDSALDKLATYGLVLALALMIILSLLNMALRWFSMTLLWIDPVVRYLVFSCAFMGGAVATGSRKHIRIDIVARILESFAFERAQLWLSRLITIFCLGTIGWLIKASYDFYLVELEFGKVEFLNIHSATTVAIIPFGLALIFFRFFVQLVVSFENLK